MSIILAIETSTELASVALLHHDTLTTRTSLGIQTHSETILPMIQQVLRQAEINLSHCDAIACGIGPGSFTGVRTACGVTLGLAFGAGLPVVPVVSLEAMAQACLETAQSKHVLALLDARMHEVYWAQYHYTDSWQAIIAPTLSVASEVIPQTDYPLLACGNGLQAYAHDFAHRPFSADSLIEIAPHAAQVARLGCHAWRQGRTMPLEAIQPLYLRNKVANQNNEQK